MLQRILILLIMLGMVACEQSTSSGDMSGEPAAGNASGSGMYRGSNVEYIVTTDPGGGYDTYARLIARYLTGNIGADFIVINNVPGAGHIVGTNTLWRARPDGFTIGTFNAGLIYNQLIAREAMLFDIGKFSWIGKAAGEPRSLLVSEQCPIKTMDDLIASKEVVKLASAGIGSASYAETRLLTEAFQLNVEIMPGYEGNEGEMSMMRGEVCGQFGSSSSVQTFVDSGLGHFILTVGGEIDGVPNAIDYAKTDRAISIIGLVGALARLGRVTAGPPGMDPELLDFLRTAYKATLQDPALRAEAERMKLPIDTADGEEVTQLVLDALNQTPEIVAIIAEAMKLESE